MKVKNIKVETDEGELIPINELNKEDYEGMLEFFHQLRLAYIVVVDNDRNE